jgi:competence protein ComEC
MRKKRFVLAGLILAFTVLLTGSSIPIPETKRWRKEVGLARNLTIYWIDTEGGAATLIITPANESVLIDAGNPGERDASRIYHVAHEIAGLDTIDHLVITHWHADHYGGAAVLSTKMPVVQVMDKGIPDSLAYDKNFAEKIEPYRRMTVQHRALVNPGSAIALNALPNGFQKLAIRFVQANKRFVPLIQTPVQQNGCDSVADKAVDSSDNANSVVLVMDYGGFRFFDGGDLTWNVEKRLVCPLNLVGGVDVYQVDHHGLDLSNHPLLIKALAPTVSIMGNGARKGCGPQTITALRTTPSIQAQYQLHKNIRQDSSYNTSEDYIANREENCQANYVKLTVDPDGKNYSVAIPANEHERTFTTKASHSSHTSKTK